MKTPLGIGVVGCGSVLAAYAPVIEHLTSLGLAQLVNGCDRDETKRNLMAEKYHIRDFTTDFQELIDSPKVDIVLILTSMPEHARIAGYALRAGKHVLVEKPLATNLDEAAELLDLAKKGSGFFFPAPFVGLSPTYRAIARHIQHGDIGVPLSARARYGWSGPWWSEWFYRSGGGAIFDLAPYNLTSLTGLLGPAKRVAAMTGIAIPERLAGNKKIQGEAEDNAQILIDFGNSTFAVVTTGFTIQQYRSPAIEVYGNLGVIQMLGDDWDPEGYELWQNDVGAWKVFKETDPNWSWCDGLTHLVQCIVNGEKPLIQAEQAYHVLEIMLCAKESGRMGQIQEVHSIFTPIRYSEPDDEVKAHLIHDRTHH
jgi:predicted dehydrogenase